MAFVNLCQELKLNDTFDLKKLCLVLFCSVHIVKELISPVIQRQEH